MKHLTVSLVLRIHARQIELFGGTPGVRSPELLESAVLRPAATFDGKPLYPGIAEKATALAFSIVNNHPFHDGNKRTGAAAMAMFLARNGHRIVASLNEQADVF
jgi:death-on-curing protein